MPRVTAHRAKGGGQISRSSIMGSSDDPQNLAVRNRVFQTTRWRIVLSAGRSSSPAEIGANPAFGSGGAGGLTWTAVREALTAKKEPLVGGGLSAKLTE